MSFQPSRSRRTESLITGAGAVGVVLFAIIWLVCLLIGIAITVALGAVALDLLGLFGVDVVSWA